MGSRYRDWAGLPGELLHIVLSKLASYKEYRSFCLVCKPWLSVVREREEEELLSLRPLLLLTIPFLDIQTRVWWLRNSSTKRKYRLNLTFRDFKSFCGMSNGWLAFVDKDNRIVLINPWSRRKIPLPLLHFESSRSTISKVVFSEDPDSVPDCLIAAIYDHNSTLAFTKLGNSYWTYMDRSLVFFRDVLFDSGRLFAVDSRGCLIRVPNSIVNLPYVDATKVDRVVSGSMRNARDAFLVRSWRDGTIRMIRRVGFPFNFDIFKLVEKVENTFQWEEIQSLDNEFILVGFNCSVSLSCLGIFSASPNCIYQEGPDPLVDRMEEGWQFRRYFGPEPAWPSKLDKLFCLVDDF